MPAVTLDATRLREILRHPTINGTSQEPGQEAPSTSCLPARPVLPPRARAKGTSIMTNQRTVVVGVDTHADTHHAAVLDAGTGEMLADRQFRADQAGYAALAEFVLAHGEPVRFGVEGTNSYGAGLAATCTATGSRSSNRRPNRAARRLRGKSDPLGRGGRRPGSSCPRRPAGT